MSDIHEAPSLIASWVQALDDENAPCGPDLEYDNQFLEVSQAAVGKPESQFGAAEAPDWVAVREGVEDMLGRSRDLRLAVLWLRSGVNLYGYVALPAGLQLLTGMMQQLGATLLPLPDPDDGDPYARVNALSVLAEAQGLVGDLRTATVAQDRALGRISGRDIELTLLLAQPLETESVMTKDQLQRMLADMADAEPGLRAAVDNSLLEFNALQAALQDFLGSAAPDLTALKRLVKGLATLMPQPEAAGDAQAGDDGGDSGGDSGGEGSATGGSRAALTGPVNNRADALRAIDMVCEFLERTEPSNPAPLFLRRARQLVNHNFLQLMRELAPDSMASVARSVGVDPESVQGPENS